MTTVRRYHTIKDTSSNNLLIADSQAKDLQFAKFSILSIPGTRIGKVTANFYPRKNQYKTIVLFVGGNDAYDRRTPSTLPALDIAKELALLADSLCDLASSVFVLGIPHRGDTRTSTVNAEIRKFAQSSCWKYWGVSEKIYCEDHLGNDGYHPSAEGRRGIQSILKNKVLYDKSAAIENNAQVFECLYKHCNCTF